MKHDKKEEERRKEEAEKREEAEREGSSTLNGETDFKTVAKEAQEK